MSVPFHPGAGTVRRLGDRRRLLPSLAGSLLIHTLILWQAPGLLLSEPSAARRGDLRAQLHSPATPPPAEQPRPRQAEPIETPPERQPEERRYAPVPAERPPPEPAAEPAPAPVEPDVQQVEPLRTGIDVAGLREYHLALGRKAGQFRRYPQAARDAGWQGRVAMRLAISETGAPISIKLLSSSEYPIIDQAALEMMFLTAGHTEVPESLRGRAFTIDLAVEFKPDDAP